MSFYIDLAIRDESEFKGRKRVEEIDAMSKDAPVASILAHIDISIVI